MDSFVISSEVTLFECNVSTILSPFVEEWLIFLIEDYVLALKLFPIVCCYGLKGWAWIETLKKLG